LWCLSCLCTLNFVLVIFRCALGVDFEMDFDDADDDEQDETMIAGPSNQMNRTMLQSMVLYDDITLDYVGVQTPR